jgi:hypothetical protein
MAKPAPLRVFGGDFWDGSCPPESEESQVGKRTRSKTDRHAGRGRFFLRSRSTFRIEDGNKRRSLSRATHTNCSPAVSTIAHHVRIIASRSSSHAIGVFSAFTRQTDLGEGELLTNFQMPKHLKKRNTALFIEIIVALVFFFLHTMVSHRSVAITISPFSGRPEPNAQFPELCDAREDGRCVSMLLLSVRIRVGFAFN